MPQRPTSFSARSKPGSLPLVASIENVRGDGRSWPVMVLLVGLVFMSYWPVVDCGYIWDDDRHVELNRLIQEPSGLFDIWFRVGATPQYYPLVFTTFWLEHQAWGLHPVGYHLTNVMLHAANVLLVLSIVRRWDSTTAIWAAALFAVHPVHVESVAWITERKNVLSGLFYLSSFLSYQRFLDGRNSASSAASDRRYWVALGLFLAALLSKSVTATLPAAILVAMWWRHSRVGLSDVRPLIPFFVFGIAAGLHTAWIEREVVGAKVAELDWSWLERLLVAGRVPWQYLAKLVWPWPLTFFYPRWWVDAGDPTSWLFPSATVLLIAALCRWRRQIGRLPLACVLYFGGTLFPVLGLLPVYPMRFSIIADHFQYLASLGPLVLAGAALARLDDMSQLASRAIGTSGVLTLVLICWVQIEDYRDEVTLWERTLAKNPDCYLCHSHLGHLAAALGDGQQAEQHYRRVVELAPRYEAGWHNLGETLLEQGQTTEAIRCFQNALREFSEHIDSRMGMSRAYEAVGDLDSAIAWARRALTLRPSATKYVDLGRLLFIHGQRDQAAEALDKSLQLDPDHLEGLAHRAALHAAKKEFASAEQLFLRGYHISPSERAVLEGLGHVCWEQRRYSEALEWYERVLSISPNDPRPLGRQALFLAAAPSAADRQPIAALKMAKELCERTNESNSDLLAIRSIALAANGQFELAIRDLHRIQTFPRQPADFDVDHLLRLFQQNSPFELANGADRRQP